MNNFPELRYRGPRQQFESAPRITSQPENRLSRRPPFLLSLLISPINIVFGIASRIFNLFSSLFPFLPRLLGRIFSRQNGSTPTHSTSSHELLGPQDTTQRFLANFRASYGEHSLPFLETGYARAFDLAKRDLKLLLVIPISPEHPDTSSFIRDTLLSPITTAFLNDPSNNTLLWAGSTSDPEPYALASALSLTTFPSAALILHTPTVSSTAMSIVARLYAPFTPAHLTATLTATLSQHSPSLASARATRDSQSATRALRDQQASAYDRSLALDRARATQKREAADAERRATQDAAQARRDATQRANDVAAWRGWRAAQIEKEPEAGPGIVRVSLRLGDGRRVMRRFGEREGMESVYAFAECCDLVGGEKGGEKPRGYVHVYGFRLVSMLPREVFGLEGTVGRIGRTGNLLVERIEEDEDED